MGRQDSKKRHKKRNDGSTRPGSQKSWRDRELSRMKRELEAERRHSARLERQVSELKKELQERDTADSIHPWKRLRYRPRADEQMRDSASRRASRYRKGSYVRYLWEATSASLPVEIITKLLLYLRRLQVLRMAATILLAVGAVAVVAVLSAAALPFLLGGAAILTTLAWLRSHKRNRIMREALTDRHIRVLVPPRGKAMETGSFFLRNAVAMAAEDPQHTAILVITPYPLSSRGTGLRRTFFTARPGTGGVYFVRRHYYFILRRRVLDGLDPRMTVVY